MREGRFMYDLAEKLWPINRSLTGDGVRETLSILKTHMPQLITHEVATGTKCFDWTIPCEWRVKEAWIKNSFAEKVVDFQNNNLHLMGYSTPVDEYMSLEELQNYLYSLPEQPNAIPYLTSYYKERWGFCLTDQQRQSLVSDRYHVYIDSELFDGSLTYGEVLIPGQSDQEIFLSTYICHPSMGNNELSGPVVATALAQWIAEIPDRRYSYRIVFIPETIGSIAYLSRHHETLKKNVVAGFNISCVGDDRCYSFLPSRAGTTLSDKVALHVLTHVAPDFKRYTWLDRGSDERQYCAPGIDLPVATIMRSKYGEYPEYHTSLDNMDLISPVGLQGSFHVLRKAIQAIEANQAYKTKVLGEPQLGKRGLYPSLSTKDTKNKVANMMNLISYCDGNRALLEIAELLGTPIWNLIPIAEKLRAHKLMEVV
ncbi:MULTISPECIES: DUF4910 domain-containing protein [unclassified Pseudovibrio]|uniref:DUF4910 domain-containing protein n=1 Tax=unclassified Pseudovibrio TaxID=2627060 RepID=UPI0007B22881|nr:MULTISPECIES: DUF4910 domain-containing protein [unclassified Pseudovibrio]KZL01857.1 hypothetical protein PsW74_01760 [Pseudovibrio sp. W74]KZL02981.1 hypothetical protein PsAD14_05766 [Pseudovibrio sp. Ad14]